ncbi:MAG: ribonuclease III [Bacteroidia bacterium]
MLSIRQVFNKYISKDRTFSRQVARISGFTPREVFLYRLAMTHSSLVRHNGTDEHAAMECNERLEYLGDSVLDTIVAEYLFKIYPFRDEGFLTEMRSKIVNRKSLNDICRRLGVSELIQHSQSGSLNGSMYGDALEAFIGAVYLDLGYKRTRKFIYRRILDQHVNMNEVEHQIISYKNKLIEYVQKEKLGILEFEVLEEVGEGPRKIFRMQALVGDQALGKGEGKNKKTAEQRASHDALLRLKVLPIDGAS